MEEAHSVLVPAASSPEEAASPPESHHLREMPVNDKLLPFIDRTEKREGGRQAGRERGRGEGGRRQGGEEKRQTDITASCL